MSVSKPFPSFKVYLGFWLLREPFTFTLEVAYRSPDSLSLWSSNLPRTLSVTVFWHQAFLVPKFILRSPLPTQQSTNSKQGPQLHFTCVTHNFFKSSLLWVTGPYLRGVESERESRSVVSDSLWAYGLYSPWNSPGQNTGLGSLSLLQGIFPTQGLNPYPTFQADS